MHGILTHCNMEKSHKISRSKRTATVSLSPYGHRHRMKSGCQGLGNDLNGHRASTGEIPGAWWSWLQDTVRLFKVTLNWVLGNGLLWWPPLLKTVCVCVRERWLLLPFLTWPLAISFVLHTCLQGSVLCGSCSSSLESVQPTCPVRCRQSYTWPKPQLLGGLWPCLHHDCLL